jgi:NTE family protein
VNDIPQDDGQWEKWRELTGYQGNIPSEVLFIDGGIMSNFPIDLFHKYHSVPSAPTFGAKLNFDRSSFNKNEKFFSLIGAIFDSSRHVHDYDFIYRNPEYKHLVCHIDTGPHNWLNFGITDEDKLDLFRRGAEAARNFLIGFDWEKYKQLRAAAMQVYEACDVLNQKEKPENI